MEYKRRIAEFVNEKKGTKKDKNYNWKSLAYIPFLLLMGTTTTMMMIMKRIHNQKLALTYFCVYLRHFENRTIEDSFDVVMHLKKDGSEALLKTDHNFMVTSFFLGHENFIHSMRNYFTLFQCRLKSMIEMNR